MPYRASAIVGGVRYDRSDTPGSFLCPAPVSVGLQVAPGVACVFTAGHVQPMGPPGYTVIDACIGGGPESPVLELRLVGDQRAAVSDPVHAWSVFRAFYGQARLDAAVLSAASGGPN